VGQRVAPLRDEPLEARQVELVLVHVEQVARRTRLESRLWQELAQLRDVDLHHLLGGARDFLAPEVVDDAVARDRPVRVQEQQCEERALLARRDPQRRIAVEDLQRA
jgi:hypothetical protein